jgi:hypothetical protein
MASTVQANTITNAAGTGSPAFTNGLTVGDGTAAVPTMTFTSDTDTGIYRSSANTLGVAAGGVSVGLISTAWSIGNNAVDVNHLIANNSITNDTLNVRNYDTTTSSDDNAGLAVIKGSTTNNTGQVFVHFAISAGATGNGQINGNGVNAAAFGSFSDARMKENIENLPSQLANIEALRPVEFDYKSGGHQIGFIAQEIQKVYPEAVSEGKDGMLMVTGWSKTEAYLVKAIQELKKEIDVLKAQITALEG